MLHEDLNKLQELRDRVFASRVQDEIIEVGQGYREISGANDPLHLSDRELRRYADAVVELSRTLETSVLERPFFAMVLRGSSQISVGRECHDARKLVSLLEDIAQRGGYSNLKPLVGRLRKKLRATSLTRIFVAVALAASLTFWIAESRDLSGKNLAERDFSGKDLHHVDFSYSVLTGAEFWGTTLSDARMRGTNLSGANLYYAKAKGVDLREANLSGADLRNASLEGADLTGADLSGAQLNGANLSGAILKNVKVDGAYLSGATLNGARLDGTDLSKAADGDKLR
jgi:hypothetical protein